MLREQIFMLVVLVFLSAFFSGIETAFMSVNIIKVKSLVKQKKRGSKALHRLKQNTHKLLITILIGNNIVNIAAASLATITFTDLFGARGVGIAVGIMTFLILVFGEITPKTFAAQNAVRISLFVARPIELLSKVLSPFVWVFGLISRGMFKVLGTRKEKRLSEEELSTIVTMGKREGILSTEAADMMHNILEFEETEVKEIMTPRINMEVIDGNKQIKDVIDFVMKKPYSKYPVFLDDENNIIGVLEVDDILRFAKNKKLNQKVKKAVNEVIFVPESKKIDDLLVEFEGKNLPMAVVVDEYGYVTGLVTIEDILEEIVGDIFDKSKKRISAFIKRGDDKTVRVDGRASIEEVNEILNLGIEEGPYDTLAGFVQQELQRIPKRGEKIKLDKATIIVSNVTKKGINSMKIIRPK